MDREVEKVGGVRGVCLLCVQFDCVCVVLGRLRKDEDQAFFFFLLFGVSQFSLRVVRGQVKMIRKKDDQGDQGDDDQDEKD